MNANKKLMRKICKKICDKIISEYGQRRYREGVEETLGALLGRTLSQKILKVLRDEAARLLAEAKEGEK